MIDAMRSVRQQSDIPSADWRSDASAYSYSALADIPPAHFIAPSSSSGLLFSAPHAGRHYASEMFSKSKLANARTLEEQGTDVIVRELARQGYHALIASASRAVVDLNRPIFAQDSKLHPITADGPDALIKLYQPYIRAGYGVIPRLDAKRRPLHACMLNPLLVEQIFTLHHIPYHRRLEQMIDHASAYHSQILLCDIHSMPDDHAHRQQADIIFGNLHGATCTRIISRSIDQFMKTSGFSWGWNTPYAGGFITRHYGLNKDRAHIQVQTLQIELNRTLFETPQRRVDSARLGQISALLSGLSAILADSL